MDARIYLLRLEVCGIKNLDKPVSFEFYKRIISNDFDPSQYKVKAIYGENGSGKTAVVTAVKILKELLTDSTYLEDSDTQRTLYALINKKRNSGYIECEFYDSFDKKPSICKYRVSFETDKDKRIYLASEELYIKNGRYSKNKYNEVYRVDNGKLMAACKNKALFKIYQEKTLNLLKKQTFALCLSSVMRTADIRKDIDFYFNSIRPFLFALTLRIYLDEVDHHREFFIKEDLKDFIQNNESFSSEDTVQFLERQEYYIQSDEVMIRKPVYDEYAGKIRRLCSFLHIFKPEIKDIQIDRREDREYYRCRLKLVYEDYVLDQEFESRGIRKLIKMFDYLDLSASGGITFIDELDSNINDVYLDKIIEFMMYYGKGQLCFTAHNLSPMSILKENKGSISFLSSINTVHTWTNNGNLSPENAYRNGFIEDSPFNTDAVDFIGILGGDDA